MELFKSVTHDSRILIMQNRFCLINVRQAKNSRMIFYVMVRQLLLVVSFITSLKNSTLDTNVCTFMYYAFYLYYELYMCMYSISILSRPKLNHTKDYPFSYLHSTLCSVSSAFLQILLSSVSLCFCMIFCASTRLVFLSALFLCAVFFLIIWKLRLIRFISRSFGLSNSQIGFQLFGRAETILISHVWARASLQTSLIASSSGVFVAHRVASSRTPRASMSTRRRLPFHTAPNDNEKKSERWRRFALRCALHFDCVDTHFAYLARLSSTSRA